MKIRNRVKKYIDKKYKGTVKDKLTYVSADTGIAWTTLHHYYFNQRNPRGENLAILEAYFGVLGLKETKNTILYLSSE